MQHLIIGHAKLLLLLCNHKPSDHISPMVADHLQSRALLLVAGTNCIYSISQCWPYLTRCCHIEVIQYCYWLQTRVQCPKGDLDAKSPAMDQVFQADRLDCWGVWKLSQVATRLHIRHVSKAGALAIDKCPSWYPAVQSYLGTSCFPKCRENGIKRQHTRLAQMS